MSQPASNNSMLTAGVFAIFGALIGNALAPALLFGIDYYQEWSERPSRERAAATQIASDIERSMIDDWAIGGKGDIPTTAPTPRYDEIRVVWYEATDTEYRFCVEVDGKTAGYDRSTGKYSEDCEDDQDQHRLA